MNDQTRILLFGTLAFGVPMSLLFWWTSGSLAAGWIVGMVAGLLFSLCGSLFLKLVEKFRVFGLKDVGGWGEDERIVYSGPANIIRNGIAEGGRLFLTTHRLRFVGHRLATQVHDSSLRLSDIATAGKRNTMGLVPNGLEVRLRDGRVLKFVVSERSRWIEAVDAARADLQTAAATEKFAD